MTDNLGRALTAYWQNHGVKGDYTANPNYPDGLDIDTTAGRRPACQIKLKHPTPYCGLWFIKCRSCGVSMKVSTTGRADDPRSVTVPCEMEKRS